ncbi:S1C family serine protease [Peribacillus loiseleuriae]|uniref:Serine protease n=1 Tax=Peribacillus loiseleuriae TaxID=1679170 RepID=A0A0K9H0R6_9BACI|nr:trypsin-like peptidase domain-containing protein [Peribacillus loiseleuriae]KMY52117.1 serine protease [Peribacillus loiseleuriae]
MGYYDDHMYENRNQKGKRRLGGYFLSTVAGVIVGALLVFFMLQGYPNSNGQNQSGNMNGLGKTEQIQQQVSVNVTSAVTDVVDKVGAAVVGITNIQQSKFWGNQESREAGTGSGVVYKKENGKAYIVTNNHVIENATELEVTLVDGTKLPAMLKGSDPWMDLAVVEVDGTNVPTVADFGTSSSLKPGEPVVAIGNPLGLQFSGSVTQGIISGLERTIEVDINNDGQVDWNAEVIQTDAAINPGNSGGALINMRGQVIGINSMKIAESAVEGIGLSIPIDSAIPIIQDLEKFGEVKRPFMGVSLASVEEISQYHQQNTLKLPTDVISGVAITSVQSNSPATKAGLEEFDVIVALDGKEVSDVVDLRKYLYNEKKIGDKLEVTYYRNGKQLKTTMDLSVEQQM